MFATYGESNLPSINSNAGPAEISGWKQLPEVAICFDQLFARMDENDDESPLTMTRIIEKVFFGKKYSNAEMAYVVAICTTMLNPELDVLQLKEKIMKSKVKHYLVGFCISWHLNKYYFINLIFF